MPSPSSLPAACNDLAQISAAIPVGTVYPPDLTLAARRPISRLGPEDGTALEWLLSGEAASAGLASLLDGVVSRLVAAGLPIGRATLHMSTLHPQLLGLSANWREDLGTCDELQVNAHVRETDDYASSPLRLIIEEGRELRLDPQDDAAAARYPILKSLGQEGYTDYWGFLLKRDELLFRLMTLATRAPGGFSDATVTAVQALLPALALNLEIVSSGKVAENVVDAYLGHRIGKRVLAGDIKRGFGETIDAVIWVSDMRDFTGLSDRIDSDDMIALLNAYFERLVDAVRHHGGEILKFIGDGMLAIFPISDRAPAPVAAAAAVAAAGEALAAIRTFNNSATGGQTTSAPWQPLDIGIALHRGPVFFGNIGSRDRLDFTVIGPAVNLAARIEPLTKQTGRRLLLTGTLAAALDRPLDQLGRFALRGVPDPVAVFALPDGNNSA